ncbi:MAG: hypothetical protein FJ276_36745 [Planctomycetes bacterium]|nr:hypothetical protein [Planctomycetota bacterium]
MFGWFRPTCPLEPHAKAWTEERLGWLADQFGLDVLNRRAVILPTADFFPDEYDGTEESVRVLLDRLCAYMDADPERVDPVVAKKVGRIGNPSWKCRRETNVIACG